MRAPDFIIGGESAPYLKRWMAFRKNRWFNIYLHQFLRSDDDRALHDHPWMNASILLRGSYLEHLSDGRVKMRKSWRPWAPWRVVVRRPSTPHRVELRRRFGVMGVKGPLGSEEVPVWTLFIVGPHVRAWGFHCPQGWRYWRTFTAGPEGETIGRGCD